MRAVLVIVALALGAYLFGRSDTPPAPPPPARAPLEAVAPVPEPVPVPAAVVPVPAAVAQALPAAGPVPQAALQYRGLLIRNARAVWGLDAPVATFAAQVHQESAWRPDAVSRVGAAGLAQFMPGTSKWIARIDPELASNEPYNPSWALRALVTYDKWLHERTPARYSPQDRMWVALRSYNGGLGHWQAEAGRTGLKAPTREQVDAACGAAKRAPVHCKENLGYPRRIFSLQPRYASWGPGV